MLINWEAIFYTYSQKNVIFYPKLPVNQVFVRIIVSLFGFLRNLDDNIMYNFLNKSLKQVFVSLMLLLLPIFLFAQADNSYTVQLQSRSFTPEESVITQSEDNLLKSTFFNDNYYLLIQFYKLPSEEEKFFLATRGINLKAYIPNMAYTASVTASRIENIKNPLIRSVFKFLPADKTVPEILNGQTIPHAIKEVGHIDLSIITYETVSAASILPSLNKLNARIIEDNPDFQTFVVRVPIGNMADIVDLPFVQWVEYVSPPDELENTLGRTLHRVNDLNDGIRNLKGDSIQVSIWDGGEVGAHIDFTPNGRLTQVEFSSPSDHATHCSGTILGRGVINPDARGMVPNAKLYSYNFNGNIQTEMATGIPLYNLMVSSHSYGSTQTCGVNGSGVVYDSRSRNTDINLNNYPFHLHCHSAGNSQSSCSGGWSTITSSGKPAKNNIVVAALSTSESLASFSSCGPVQDGRIKPEISALGTSVLSTLSNNNYANYSGTSMATPGVAGTVALLVQRYRQLNANALPPSSLIKNSILNTAEDLGNPGPDYRYGFGRINALEAVKMLEQNRYVVNTISTGNTNNITVTVPAGATKLRVMLTWNDPAGASNAAIPLVNNLDLSVINGTTTTLPWILDKNNPGAVALRGVDNVSNIEQVTIDNPTAGTYTLRVNGLAVPIGGNQQYALTWSIDMPGLEIVYPNGNEHFSSGSNETIRWNNNGVTANQTLQYSTNGGTSWTTIASNINANTRNYVWNPPNLNTGNALIRVTSGAFLDQSDALFTILGRPGGFAGSSNNTCNAGEINFTWNAVSNATHYDIMFLNSSTGNFDTLGTNITGTSYTGTGLTPNTSMWFYIVAKNNTTGAISKRSNSINVTTSSSGVGLSAPGNISGATSVCSLTNGVAYSISPVTGAVFYTWTVPNGANIVNGQGTANIIVDFTNGSTSGNISVVASNNICTSTPSQLAVTVSPLPTQPVISTTDPQCISGTGVITVTSPLATGLEYSINGTNYQSGTTFSPIPGTYNVTARVSNNPTCVSVATQAVINVGTINCVTDLAAGAQNLNPSIPEGGTSTLNFIVSNIGTAATNGGPIMVTIFKPSNASSFILNLPPGWTIVSNNPSLISITSNNIIQPGLANAEIITAIYTHNNTNEDAVKNSYIYITPGSNGETDGSNNQGGTFIQVN